MEIMLIWIVLGVVTGAIAEHKGKSPVLWGIYGCLLPIMALPVLLFSSSDKRECPSCGARVPKMAQVCMRCTRPLSPSL